MLQWAARPGIILLDSLVLWYYKKTNEALYNSLMKRSQELEAASAYKNFFIRVTNHELKGPLNAIHEISQTLLLHDEVEENPTLKPLAEDLYTASSSAMLEVTNVLDMSRIEAGKLHEVDNAPFNIRQYITNLCKVHQYSASRKQVQIITEFQEQLPPVIVGDKAKLTKILGNLLINAIKFTAAKSRVTVKAGIRDKQLYLAVKDQGKGIQPERLRTIFDPFETEQNSLLEGSGLGLFITRHFVALLGGQIAVQSTPGEGTMFTILLPLVTAQKASPANRDAVAPANYQDKQVLICEDDQISQLYLAKFLERSGCTTLLADNGAMGISMALQDMPDLVIIDSHMPVMSGKATITHIRQHPRLQHLPVIVISGDAYPGESEELLAAGANEYLVKPVSFKTLNDVIGKYLTSPEYEWQR
jgi:CheY-like chemotaxis protein/nitrogen-specific signal transduction histidine kinase